MQLGDDSRQPLAARYSLPKRPTVPCAPTRLKRPPPEALDACLGGTDPCSWPKDGLLWFKLVPRTSTPTLHAWIRRHNFAAGWQLGACFIAARVGAAGGVGRDATNQPPIHRLFRCRFFFRSVRWYSSCHCHPCVLQQCSPPG